jgi:hypothetical protein
VQHEISRPYEVFVVEAEPPEQYEYLGELAGDPHMYEITSEDPFTLRAQVRQLDTESLVPFSLIAVRVGERNEGVTEVARLRQPAESWTTVDDARLALTLRESDALAAEVAAGTYRIEISTPENFGVYQLAIGETPVELGYFATLGAIRTTQAHFGAGWFTFLRSSYVFYPLGSLLLLGAIWYVVRRIRQT